VLLANGKTVPISSLKVGDKVKAVNTRTGKAQVKDVQAVLVHYDTDLYDLMVKTARGTEVIDTTSNHLFWDPARHQWVKAASLKHGEHLLTANGTPATADGGHTPADRDGWMWDLTIQQDHDFYVLPGVGGSSSGADIGILVRNCGLNDPSSEISQVSMRARMENGISRFRNVAAYRIGEGENARYLAAASDAKSGLHSEEILNNFIDSTDGLSRDDVTGIYSERMPCTSHTCMDSMSTFKNAQSDISYSLSPDLDSQAMRQNASKIGSAMGEYQGPAAGLPRAEWITP
jgi:hypothetical protein